MSTHKGSCLCQAVQYEITVPEGGHHSYTVCHCKDCQKTSGSAFSTDFVLPTESMKLTKGAEGAEVKVYMVTKTTSGNTLGRYFCGMCGSTLYVKTAANDGIVILQTGTLDDPIDATIHPTQEIFCLDRRAWLKPVDGVKQVQKMFE